VQTLSCSVPQKESVTTIVVAVAHRRRKVGMPLLYASLLSTLAGVKRSYQKPGYYAATHSCAIDVQRQRIYAHQVSSVLSPPPTSKTAECRPHYTLC
jgi:hypothetical protein